MESQPPTVPRIDQPCYLVYCLDGDGVADLRRKYLEGHLRHVEAHWQRYITAGPLRDPGGEALVGSLFLVLAPSLDDAKALMEGDPYVTCGLYRSVEYRELTNSIGQYIGGKIWDDIESIRHRAAGGPVEVADKQR